MNAMKQARTATGCICSACAAMAACMRSLTHLYALLEMAKQQG